MIIRSSHRIVLSALLFCFSFLFVAATAFAPQRALALGNPPAPVYPTAEVPTAPVGAAIVKREVKLTVGQAVLSSAVVGLINAITLAGQQIAFDLAVGLASGCKGESACAIT